jgi:hypothetical protein
VTARYDLTQRSYVLTGSEGPGDGTLRVRLEADAGSPVHNPALIVEDWGNRGAALEVDGESVPRGDAFRFGHIRRVNRYDLVVWVRKQATTPVRLSLSSN